MKYEWRKQSKELYLPKNKPETVNIPNFKFFMIDGRGNPNDEKFSEAIGLLYSVSYAMKMLPKKGIIPDGYFDYTVFPLEGTWDLVEGSKTSDILDKNNLIYTIMIRQPDFVTNDLADEIVRMVRIKKSQPLIDKIRFNSIEEGLCVQMLHVGSYDDEVKSFSVMEDYCIKNDLKRISKVHREIYISDVRKTQPNNLKTVLRFQVEHIK